MVDHTVEVIDVGAALDEQREKLPRAAMIKGPVSLPIDLVWIVALDEADVR